MWHKIHDKHLLREKMPINSVALWTRLTSHKPQQRCIHCNSVSKDKFLPFDKTIYREKILWIKWQKMVNKTSFVTTVKMQFSESLLLHVLHMIKQWKICLHWNLIWINTPHWKQDTRNAEIKQNELLHMQELLLTTPTKMYMCVLQHRCAERYM